MNFNQSVFLVVFFIEGLNEIEGLKVNVAAVETNIVSKLILDATTGRVDN